jgi:hypothetical protein
LLLPISSLYLLCTANEFITTLAICSPFATSTAKTIKPASAKTSPVPACVVAPFAAVRRAGA